MANHSHFLFRSKGNNVLKRCLTGVLALLASAASCAQTLAQTAASPIVIAKLNANEVILLDGSLSHPAWQRAAAYDNFIEREPKNGAVPKQRTTVRALSDERALYFGIEAFDTEPEKIRAPMVRHDGVNRTQDFVVVYVDAVGARKAAQFFRVSASGSTARASGISIWASPSGSPPES